MAEAKHTQDVAKYMMTPSAESTKTTPVLSTIPEVDPPPTHSSTSVPESKPLETPFKEHAKAVHHSTQDALSQAVDATRPYFPSKAEGTHVFAGRHTVVLATMPQDVDVKAYGDIGTLIGGIFTRNLALQLREERVISPLNAATVFRASGKQGRANDFLKQIDIKMGFNGHEANEMNRALCQQVTSMCKSDLRPFDGPERYLVLRTDVDWTRPYTPPTKWQKVAAWFRDDFSEEAYGFVDVDAQLFERDATGYYRPIHQWQGEHPLRTDRIVGANLSVYDDPTANTWGTRVAHEIFEGYWDDRLTDYGQIKHFNPLNRFEIPTSESFKYRSNK